MSFQVLSGKSAKQQKRRVRTVSETAMSLCDLPRKWDLLVACHPHDTI